MLGLRLQEGVELEALARQAGMEGGREGGREGGQAERVVRACEAAATRFVPSGTVRIEKGGEGRGTRVVLTDPRGFLVSNEIIAELFVAAESAMASGEERGGGRGGGEGGMDGA
jgi:hypothetical protein